jgi:hypothetical protein
MSWPRMPVMQVYGDEPVVNQLMQSFDPPITPQEWSSLADFWHSSLCTYDAIIAWIFISGVLRQRAILEAPLRYAVTEQLQQRDFDEFNKCLEEAVKNGVVKMERINTPHEAPLNHEEYPTIVIGATPVICIGTPYYSLSEIGAKMAEKLSVFKKKAEIEICDHGAFAVVGIFDRCPLCKALGALGLSTEGECDV